ncbi:flagellar hook-length control protein FliK [Pseudidiomarina sp. CB1]|uniref:flagellar hook-length control protein FliK n=1 Tax=Pseudidiomarina sp. CB1 TaxID=2972484 RepID=UPI0021617813|nr:flagellar hook-length control protein FliK [Pseudidiomarina sp. CB1]
MSSITPLLDTLVHQVAKQKATVDLLPRGAPPVVPVQATASTTEFSQAGQQFSRLLQIIEGLQQQLPSQTPGRAIRPTANQPIFPSSHVLSVASLADRLGSLTRNSGLFYEAFLSQWVKNKVPFEVVRQQPQNLAQNQQIKIASQQLEMISSGVVRFEFDVSPDIQLFGVIQPDVHPLVKRWQQEQAQPQEHDEANDWTTELRITFPILGTLRARLRMQEAQLSIELQCDEEWRDKLQAASEEFRARLMNAHGIKVSSLIVRGGQ